MTESSRLKMKESINLKALAQMILDQRSDIEQFFLEALEQVKEEKRRKLEQERNAENLKCVTVKNIYMAPNISIWQEEVYNPKTQNPFLWSSSQRTKKKRRSTHKCLKSITYHHDVHPSCRQRRRWKKKNRRR